MYRLFFVSLFFISSILTKIILGQGANSIQINGGVISPMSSSKGFTGLIQFNHPINSDINFYLYSGYSSWDQYKVVLREDLSAVQKQQYFNSYSSDGHVLIPIYIGSRINLHTNKLFTSYLTVEAGYSYLSYNSYKNWKSIDPVTGEVLGYYADRSTKKENREDLFGVGIGAGLSHPLTKYLNLILSFKLNSYINSKYSGLFSNRGTYTMLLAGISFGI